MALVCYRCPTSGEDVTTAIQTRNEVLVQMREKDLTLWVWCPHCIAGHQINPADAVLVDAVETVASPSLADA
jgi:hypothetical protein